MAVNTQRISNIEGARARRLALPRYLRLDGGRFLLGLVLILSLMSLILLAQTGVVATKGYAISALEAEKVALLRERTLLQERQARAQSLERIRRRAEQIGLRPITDEQVRYMEIEEGTGDGEQGTGADVGGSAQGIAPPASPANPVNPEP